MQIIKRIIIFFVITFLLAEILFRIFLSVPDFDYLQHTNLRVRYSRDLVKRFVPDQKVYESVSTTWFDTTKIKYRINSSGLRGGEVAALKKKDAVRILVIGGSHVFDLNCSEPDGSACFTTQLEEDLRKDNIQAELINAGLPGQNIKNILLRMNEISLLKPDIVILNTTYNDVQWMAISDTSNFASTIKEISNASFEKAGINPLIEPYIGADNWFGSSVVYRIARACIFKYLIENFMTAYYSKYKKDHSDASADYYAACVKRFVSFTKEMGALPVLALEERLPDCSNANENFVEPLKMNYLDGSRINDHLAKQLINRCDSIQIGISQARQIPLIDFRNKFYNKENYFKDFIHTSREGSIFMATLYAQALEKITKEKK